MVTLVHLPLIICIAHLSLCTSCMLLKCYAWFQVPLSSFAIIQLSVIWWVMRFRCFDLQIILYTLVCSFSFQQSTGFYYFYICNYTVNTCKHSYLSVLFFGKSCWILSNDLPTWIFLA